MYKVSHTTTVWLILMAVFLVGCATTTERMDDLDNTLRAYKKSIRWADFAAAYSFRKWQEGDVQAPPESLKDVRVTRYEVGNSQLSKDKLSYSQVVKISYYRMDSAREREIIDRQRWEYDETSARWMLVSEIPAF